MCTKTYLLSFSHQIQTYNDFIQHGLPTILSECRPITWFDRSNGNASISIKLTNCVVTPPKHGIAERLLPRTCRQLGISYNGQMRADLTVSGVGISSFVVQDVLLGVFACMWFAEYTAAVDVVQSCRACILPAASCLHVTGDIPVMLGSCVCWIGAGLCSPSDAGESSDDPFGYFVINGQEKCLVTQERVVTNNCVLYSVVPTGASTENKTLVIEIRSCASTLKVPITFSVRVNTNESGSGALYACLSFFRANVPIVVLLLALGMSNLRTIASAIASTSASLTVESVCLQLESSSRETSLTTRDEALDALLQCAPLNQEGCKDQLLSNLLPHIPHHDDKALYVCYMIGQLLQYRINPLLADDRDSYSNKRLETPGILLCQQTRMSIHKLRIFIERSLAKSLMNVDTSQNAANIKNITDVIRSVFASHSITRSVMYSMQTGNWNLQATGNVYNSNGTCQRTGVVQLLTRFNMISTLSHLRRVNTPLERVGKVSKPRALHISHYGYLCPVETPEGPSCGLIKNIAIGAVVTSLQHQMHDAAIQQSIIDALLLNQTSNYEQRALVFFNGSLIGRLPSEAADEAVQVLYQMKFKCVLFRRAFLSVYRGHDNHVYVSTDEGRMIRYFFTTNNNGEDINVSETYLPLSLDQAIADGMLVYLDIAEMNTHRIAIDLKTMQQASSTKRRYTVCEIHPALILGVTASLIPFIEYNQSPRNTYQTSMSKQAIGIACTAASQMDLCCHTLCSPQVPLVYTDGQYDYNIEEKTAVGQNFLVAVCPYSGANQNDSIVMHRGSIERGLATTIHQHVVKLEIRPPESLGMITCDSATVRQIKMNTNNWCILNQEIGIVSVGAHVTLGDPLVFISAHTNYIRAARADEHGRVQRIELVMAGHCFYQDAFKGNVWCIGDENIDNVRERVQQLSSISCKSILIRIRFGNMRYPELGDKLASRGGQKGTIGAILDTDDMPFTALGMVPDLIFNSHGIPSRMTIGQVWETIVAKLNAIVGQRSSAAAFGSHTYKNTVFEHMRICGYQQYGREKLFSGITGEPLDGSVYFGIVYYQRLKHMVQDKMHARALGPVTQLVRQPTDGRARAGGLRIGEMERDCILGHGAMSFLRERLMWKSDAYTVLCCPRCGQLRAWRESGICSAICRTNVCDFKAITLPYSCKLLIQEITSTGVALRLRI